MKTLYPLILCMALISGLFSQSLFGQNDIDDMRSKLPKMLGSNNVGKDFWFSFHPCYEEVGPNNALRIYVSSGVATQVHLEVPAKGINMAKTTIANDVIEFILSPVEGQCYTKEPGDPSKPDAVYPGDGIHVYSDDPIVCYGVTRYNRTSDGFLALPTNSLGKDYRAATYNSTTDTYSSYVSIVGVYDNTLVKFYMGGNVWTITTGGMQYPDVVEKTLNKGDVWLIASNVLWGDLSGSKIRSSKPVAVTSGNFCVYIPYECGFCNFIIEMELPVYTWGKEYLVSRIAERLKPSIIKIFSSESHTRIYRDGALIQYIPNDYGVDGDGYIEMRATPDLPKPVVISGDKPICVSQYNTGQEDDGLLTDPFKLVLTPLEQFQKEIIFNTPGIKGGFGFAINYLNVVYPTDEFNTIPPDLQIASVVNGQFDWKPIDMYDGFKPELFGSKVNDKYYASKIVTLPGDGVYKIRANDPFAVYSYGFANHDAYGFPTSVALGDISKPDTVPPVPTYTIGCNGNVTDGFVKDLPLDDSVRSNLSIIVYDFANSYNYDFKYKDFMPGDDQTTTWTLTVVDPMKDARAKISFSDRRGNDTTIIINYIATKLTIRPDYYDYGLLTVGEQIDHTFWAINEDSTNSAYIKEIKLMSGNQGFVISGLNLPVMLPPLDSVSFTVRFTATEISNNKFIDSIGIGDTCVFAYKAMVEASVGEPVIHVTSPGNMGDISVGKTKFGMCTIQNKGSVDLKIFGHTEPTQSVFTHDFPLVSFSDPLIIKPGDVYNFQVTFKPDAEGYFPPPGPNDLDSMVFFSNAVKMDSTAYFSGRGIQASLVAHSINWKPLRINRPVIDPRGPYPATSDYCDVSIGGILLENNGTEEVRIFSINATGDVNGFVINNNDFVNLIIPAHTDTIIPVFFQPNNVGQYSVKITYSNSISSNTETLLTGTGILPKISTADVDFDTTIVNDVNNARKRKIRFTNDKYEWNDSLTITDFITHPDNNAISPDWNVYGSVEGFKFDKAVLNLPIVLQPGNYIEFDAEFVAQKGGDASGSLSSVSDAETDTTSHWKGFGLTEGVIAKGGSAYTCVNETDLIACTVQNTGTAPLVVTSLVISQIDPAFYFENPADAAGFILQPNEVRNIMIRYQPSKAGLDTADLIVNNKTLDSSVIVADPKLTGTAVHFVRNIKLTVAAGSKNPKIGARVNASISIDPGDDISVVNLKELNFNIKYTGIFLRPVSSEIKTGSQTRGKFEILNINVDELSNLITFKLRSLGNASINEPGSLVDLAFDSFLPTSENTTDSSVITPSIILNNSPCLNFTTIGDSIVMQSTCAYNLRLINVAKPGNDYAFKQISPNPLGTAGGSLEFSIAFDGMTEIEIINIAGEVVLKPLSEEITAGPHTLRIPVEKLSSGVYYCKLKSGPYMETREMVVVK